MQANRVQFQQQQVSAAEFGAKFKSKKEIYRFLTCEVKAYLDQYDAMTIW